MEKKKFVKCKRCGKEVPSYWWTRKYCARCRVEVDKELRTKYSKNK